MFCVYRLANIQECLGNHGPISRWNHGHPCVNWLFTKHGSSSRGNDVMLPLSDAGEETLTMLLTSRDGSKGWSPGPLCPVSPAPEARAERQCVSVSVSVGGKKARVLFLPGRAGRDWAGGHFSKSSSF